MKLFLRTVVAPRSTTAALSQTKNLQTCASRSRLCNTNPDSQNQQRFYAAQPNEAGKRRTVTSFNDDGHVPWRDLSAGEKVGRAMQQSFNFSLVLVGVVMTGGVAYFFCTEVLASESKTAYFNRAAERIKRDPRCLEVLGDAKQIKAYGHDTNNKWQRSRPIVSTVSMDRYGQEHMALQFIVEGPKATGLATLQLVRRAGTEEYQYRYLFVDVRGHRRIYLENTDPPSSSLSGGDNKKELRMFGVKWT